MTREQAKQLLPVIQAWADGKTIQTNANAVWHDFLHENLSFEYEPQRYRIKPKPLEFWIQYNDKSSRRSDFWTHEPKLTPDDKAAGWRNVKMREVSD